MFDGVDDVGVIDALRSVAREENAACARRLAVIGELYARRTPPDEDQRAQWAIDGFDTVVAEISAALGVSRGRARYQLRYAITLRDVLPRVAAVFASGAIDFAIVATIIARTDLIEDPGLRAQVDAALARRAPRWTKLSARKLAERVDWFVARIDPGAVRVARKPVEDRDVVVVPLPGGMALLNGWLPLSDAAVVDDRLDALADTVCRGDGRTRAQRRADALVALAGRQNGLVCGCGRPDCSTAGGDEPKPVGQVIIHVLSEQPTLDGTAQTPAYVIGQGPIPAAVVRDLAATATMKPLARPSPIAEPGYRPSAGLAAFVRARDLCCRFPGCDAPAAVCDIDHTRPHPLGSTHPSNLKLLCRFHHLLKTFYPGPGGWTDRQLPDGTVIWAAPTGHTYTTTPEGAAMFPVLGAPTGTLTLPAIAAPAAEDRGLMMPRRKHTRDQDRRYRITAERAINEARLANQLPARPDPWSVTLDDPPESSPL